MHRHGPNWGDLIGYPDLLAVYTRPRGGEGKGGQWAPQYLLQVYAYVDTHSCLALFNINVLISLSF